MKRLEGLIDTIYTERHQQQLDTVLPIIADEGMGKSTLMLQLGLQYCYSRDGQLPDTDEFLDRLCFDRAGFQQKMAESDKQALIMVPDAARILYSMDVAKSEQKQIEKDLMDVRGLEYMILLGFQSWDRIGGEIKERRSKMALKIPRRGLVRGYNRGAMDEKLDNGRWPESVLTDKFPSLEGTELWEKYQALDREKKRERLSGGIEETVTPEQAAKDANRRLVLRAVQPWHDDRGMSYREAATLVDFGKDWVGDTVREWQDGYHQDLLDTDGEKTAVREAIGS